MTSVRMAQDRSDEMSKAPSTSQDYLSILVAIIEKVSKDPALLRSLVYALAWNSLVLDCVVAYPGARAKQRAKTLVELDRAFTLEFAIKRVEAEISRQSNKIINAPQQSSSDRIPEGRQFSTLSRNAQVQNLQNNKAAFYHTSEIPRRWSQKNEGFITIRKRVLAWPARTFGFQLPKWVHRKIGIPLKTMRTRPTRATEAASTPCADLNSTC